MTEFFESIQFGPFGMWVTGGEGIWRYPFILALHTVGLGITVGASIILSSRVLGLSRTVPLRDLRRLFRAMAWGFGLNAATGIVLFIAQIADLANREIFWIKLGLIFFAVIAVTRLRETAYSDAGTPVSTNAKGLAIVSLVLWMAAIVAGRLVAYFP